MNSKFSYERFLRTVWDCTKTTWNLSEVIKTLKPCRWLKWLGHLAKMEAGIDFFVNVIWEVEETCGLTELGRKYLFRGVWRWRVAVDESGIRLGLRVRRCVRSLARLHTKIKCKLNIGLWLEQNLIYTKQLPVSSNMISKSLYEPALVSFLGW